MRAFIDSLRRCVETENWHAGIMMALAIPDICGRLMDPLMPSRARYEKWFEHYLGPMYRMDIMGHETVFLTGGDCYALRCAMLHEGNEDTLTHKAHDVVEKVMFTTLGDHRGKMGPVLVINAGRFCDEVASAAKVWMADVSNDPIIQAAMNEMLTVRTEGFNPVPGVRIGA